MKILEDAIFDASPLAVLVMDPEGRIRRWSRGAERLFGWREEEALGCICPTVPQEGLEDFHRMITQAIREGSLTGLVRYRQKKDGAVIHTSISVAAISDADGNPEGVVAILEDITARVQAEERLQESERQLRVSEKRLRAILQAEPECVKVVTEDGTLLEMNAAGLAMIEADSLDQVRGQSVCSLIEPAYRARFTEFNRRVFNGKPETMEFEIIGLKGTKRWMESHAVPLRDEHNVTVGVLAVTHDITERKQTDTIRKLLIEKGMNVQEEERRRLAHELHDETGQSLAALLRGLRQLEVVPTLEAAHAQIRELAKLTLHAIDEIRRLITGLRPRLLDDLGLEEALKRHVDDFGQHQGFEIDFQSNGLSRHRLSDAIATALYRIVQEALTNVAKHSGASKVSLVLLCAEADVRLIVEDDGRGFDKETALRVEGKTTHLGIHGMRKRTNLLNGSFAIETTPGRGTTVYVQIPLTREAQ